jgi:hypothetical protein
MNNKINDPRTNDKVEVHGKYLLYPNNFNGWTVEDKNDPDDGCDFSSEQLAREFVYNLNCKN